jgi:hypothetical protein
MIPGARQRLQFGLGTNVARQTFADVLDRTTARGMKIAVHRPFSMGRMLYENR